MRILILTQYFPPETGAPQNRLYNLAMQLKKRATSITVLTAFPNYPRYEIMEGYRGKWFAKEVMDGLLIFRSYIFVKKSSSLFLRLLNYFSFVFSSLIVGLFKVGKADLIICESPPLFLGITAVFLKKIKKAKLVFNVSDLWPESAVKLGLVTNPFFIRLSTFLEEWIYRNADYISGQTQGIVRNIQNRFPHKPVFWLRNGVNSAELQSRITDRNWKKEMGYDENDFLLYFGGLVGYAQGLDCILKAANRLKHLPAIQFAIVGDGPDKKRLEGMKEYLQIPNLKFYEGVPKNEIADVINSVDVAIIPLKRLDIFLGAIPSKIFEILSLKKPLLLGIEGEAKTLFIEEGKAGLAFKPENDEELAEQILNFYQNPALVKEFGNNGSKYVKQYFDQAQISIDFWHFLHPVEKENWVELVA